MKTCVILVSIEKERELYEALLSATMNHTEYDGCYIMQYSEHRGDEGHMVGEFTLIEKGGPEAAMRRIIKPLSSSPPQSAPAGRSRRGRGLLII